VKHILQAQTSSSSNKTNANKTTANKTTANMPTVAELKEQCKSLGLKVGGSKKDLELRIAAHFGDQSAADDDAPDSFPPTKAAGRSRASSVASTVSTGSTSSALGRMSSGGGQTKLTSGSALISMMPHLTEKYNQEPLTTVSDIHQATYDCLEILLVLHDPKPATFDQPPSVTNDLEPIKFMIQLLVDSSNNLTPTTSYSANVRDLIGLTKQEWSGQYITSQSFVTAGFKREVATVLRMFLGDAIPEDAIVLNDDSDSESDAGEGEFEPGFVEETEDAMDKAVAEVVKLQARFNDTVDQPDADLPSDNIIKSHISDRGISFRRLVRTMAITNGSKDFLARLHRHIITNKLANFDVFRLLFIPCPEPNERLKSDEVVRAAMPHDGRPISRQTFLQDIGLAWIEKDAADAFIMDLYIRGVIQRFSEGVFGIVLPRMAPADPEASTSNIEGQQVLVPVTTAEDRASALTEALARVKLGIQQFLRNWCKSFPEPTIGTWPGDFSAEERESVRQLIKPYVLDAARHLLSTPLAKSDLDDVVQDIQNDPAFQVPKARNVTVITQVVKMVISKQKQTLKAQAVKAAEAEAKRKREEGDDGEEEVAEKTGVDQDAMDIDEEEGAQTSSHFSRPTARSRKTRRVVEDDEDDEDGEGVAEGAAKTTAEAEPQLYEDEEEFEGFDD
jgi:hypothetical protein